MLLCFVSCPSPSYFFFFFNDTATTEIYTLSLHDALPISHLSFCVLLQYLVERRRVVTQLGKLDYDATPLDRKSGSAGMPRPISYAVFCLKKKKLLNLQPNRKGCLSHGRGLDRTNGTGHIS